MNDVLQALLLVSILTSLSLAAYGFRQRPRPGATSLSAFMLSTAVWAGGALGASLADTLAASILWTRFEYLGIVGVPITFFALAARYTGNERLLTRPRTLAISVVGLGIVLGHWTTDLHSLFYVDVFPSTTTLSGYDVVHGPLFYVWIVVGYALTFGGCALLARMLYHSQRIYRRQAGATLLAAVAPLVSNAAYVLDVTNSDLTPIAFAACGGALGWAMHRFEFMDLTPVARETVVENIRDGVLVLDDADRIVDVNPTGRHLLDVDGDDTFIGTDATEALDAPFDALLARFSDVDRGSDVVTFETERGKRFLDVDVLPYTDLEGRDRGRLFYLQDVTERERRERELERQNEQLDRFASLVSHDLRNPLNVAEGYVQNASTTDDFENLDEVAAAHDRMRAIIDDVLDLARQGRTVTDVAPVSVATVAEDAWRSVDTANATLDVTATATVVADESRLRQLFENCYRNSVEHGSTGNRTQSGDSVEHGSTGNRTQSGDSVEHGSTGNRTQSGDSVEHGGADVVVTVGDCDGGFFVADDGPGIPEDEREAVLDDGYTTHPNGTGLGLSIVKSIATAHDWTVTVEASTTGGARFTFTGTTYARDDPRTAVADD